MMDFHIRKVDDAEDFDRAVSRGDVLFYHSTLERALDHFLQALFALNRIYFPSRKRSLEYIAAFSQKPVDCGEKLLEVIALGAKPETLDASYALWKSLCNALIALCEERI